MKIKRFLFLQGVCSPFFAQLAQKLRSEGHQVFKVAFNAGDWWYGGRQGGIHYRGHVNDLASFLSDCYSRLGITDQVLFGDCRPIHIQARKAAKACGIETHVFEEGYFRPYWITLEREGVNANSLLPRNPDWFLAAGEYLPNYGDGQSFKHSFPWRSYHDVAYHVAGMWNPLFFPKYRTHSPVIAPIEYACYIKRLSRTRYREKSDAVLIDNLVSSHLKNYFVLPLQLDSDSQIKMHSRFTNMREVISLVLASFGLHAPKGMSLVIKNHPLDSGLVDYEQVVRELAREFGLSDRVYFLETGNLHKLLTGSAGLVTVNSTAGGLALDLGCPTVCLSDPIYNLPGLTYQGALDDFWLNPAMPDAVLLRCFRNTVIHTTQINGGFYCETGITLAVNHCAPVLIAERSPLDLLLAQFPCVQSQTN